MEEKFNLQGIKINYYYICKRKLWLFSKGITMENSCDRVQQGKVLHEDSYKKEKNKEILIDNLLKLDIVDKDYIKEVKISSKMEKADKMQLYYYLYYLKNKGIYKKGKINYVKEKKVEEILLTSEIEKELDLAIDKIIEIENAKMPPKLEKLKICSKCAYYEFCFAKEN